MENTQEQNTPETLKPEQMESGKWYVVTTRFKFLSKFKEIIEEYVHEYKGYSYYGNIINGNVPLCDINEIQSICPATKEEVLKYFPDEVFESKVESWKADVSQEAIPYKPKNIKTEPIELRSEETTNWEAKYNELKSRYEVLVTEAHKLDVISGEMCDKYTELKAKYDQLQPKCEKVYFYFNENKGHITYTENLERALNLSPQDSEIYEGIKIGIKKSVLVNETT